MHFLSHGGYAIRLMSYAIGLSIASYVVAGSSLARLFQSSREALGTNHIKVTWVLSHFFARRSAIFVVRSILLIAALGLKMGGCYFCAHLQTHNELIMHT